MQILKEFPPNIEAIRKRFLLSGNEIFAYGDTIYSPGGVDLPDSLLRHEEVHEKQQGDDPEGWWARFLKDDKFRLDQEMEAHIVEYQTICKKVTDRNERVKAAAHVAHKIASATYGRMISYRKAMDIIRKAPV